MILNSPYISGSITVTGNATIQGTISGSVSGTASNATTASFAATASSADNLLVRNTLTAQTLVVQTITSSVDFVTGSTQFGSLLANTHVFSGSVTMNPGGLFVSSSGRVGIGTTSPNEILEILSPEIAGTSQQTKIRITQAASVSSRVNLIAGVISGSNPYFAIEARQAGSPFAVVERLRIDGNGNVGIGTSSPLGSDTERTLHLSDGGAGYTTLYVTNGANTLRGIFAISNASSTISVGTQTNHDFRIVTNDTPRIRITSGGALQTVGSGYYRNSLQQSYFGYNGVYRTLIVGSTGTDYTTDAITLAFNVDVSGNVNGSFTGAGSEYVWRNTASFITPNSSNNGYNTLLNWNSNGVLTTPNRPAFRAGRSSSVTPGSNSTIIFNSTSGFGFNVGGHYSTSTGRFTAPVTGIYNFNTCVIWESLGSGQAMDDAFEIKVNGTTASYSFRRATYVANTTGIGGYYVDHATVLLNLTAGQYVEVVNRYAGLSVHGNQNYCYFTGYLVG